MKRTPSSALALLPLFLATRASLLGLPVPEPVAPAETESTIVFHPSLSWESVVADGVSVRVQIARDAEMNDIADEDLIHSIAGWYVPARRLAPGAYWWRVRNEADAGEAGAWSKPRSFSIVEPEKTFRVHPEMDAAAIRAISTEAAAADSASIVFAPGHYRIDPGHQRALFDWQGAENIVVEGGGARIELLDPSAQLWKIDGCRNILIGDLSAEYADRPHTIARVAATDHTAGTLDAEYLDGYAEALYPRMVNQMFCYARDPKNPRRLHPDRPGHLFFSPEKTIANGVGKLRYFVRDREEFRLLDEFQPGDEIVVCYRRWPLGYVHRSQDVTLHGITLTRSEAPYFMGGGNSDMKFLALRAPSEEDKYPSPAGWVTGNDRHGPWIEGCFFEAIADDGPNITGNAYMIETIERGELAMRAHVPWQNPVWQVGDQLVFWNPVDGHPVQTAPISEVLTSPAEVREGIQRVRLADSLSPAMQPGPSVATDTHVYNVSCQNSGFVARYNKLTYGRRFGFNVKANRALIEHNTFEGLSSSAVYLENAPTFWEGLACDQVVIQKNEILNCGDSVNSARRRRASGIFVNLWKYPARRSYDTTWQGHRNILIRDNTIIDWESAAIAVDNVVGVRISGNTITNRSKTGFLTGDNTAILAGIDASDVEVGDNTIADIREFTGLQTAPLVEAPTRP